jgi:hypothetical protein
MRVVDAIVCAVTRGQSPFRYRVGTKATLLSLGRRILSDRLIARAVRREFQLEASPAASPRLTQ